MKNPITKLLTLGDARLVRTLAATADQISDLEDHYKQYTDAEILAETDILRQRIQGGADLDTILPLAFANAREASRRVLGMFPYKVQLMGGIALHKGHIAELSTGSGKTLTAVAPVYLNALTGEGVHVVTVNDYLAETQAKQMGRVFHALGLTTGIILANQDPYERKKQYECDVTYGTNNEFGFDYLKDNMAFTPQERVQRGHNFVIIDEVDSILIDEARTPLIISGPAQGDTSPWFSYMAHEVESMREGIHYISDEKKRTVSVLDPALDLIEDNVGINNLYDNNAAHLVPFLNNAIKAKALFHKNKDYVVTADGEIAIVDEHTGRILPGRRFNDGLHQALEAKEKVEIKPENQTMASVTLQNYFRMYNKMSGMTGTAETEAAEFAATYNMRIAVIPDHKPKQRIDQEDLVYKNERAKLTAIIQDVQGRYQKGQPVLIGTTSVAKSAYLSKLLAHAGIPHEVLNAKHHDREAAIVAKAGCKGAVTVATNMAGRGTDIILGGNPEVEALHRMEREGLTPNSPAYDQVWIETLNTCKAETAEQAKEVIQLGGLYVIGTERHDSRRIDNQLRGRAGRQGDPGESRFYLALTDDLMRLFNKSGAERLMANAPDDMALEHKIVSKVIANAQANIEQQNAEQRKNTLKYDDIMDRQRKALYKDRNDIVDNNIDLKTKIENIRKELITDTIQAHTKAGTTDYHALWEDLRAIYPVSISIDDLAEDAGGNANRVTSEQIIQEILADAELQYREREAAMGERGMRNLEKRTLLRNISAHWPGHLLEMDYLKEGIGLRALAQKDPLVEYQREGYALYQETMRIIQTETIHELYTTDITKARRDLNPLAGFIPQNLKLTNIGPDENGNPATPEK